MGRERCVGKEEDRLGIDTIAGREVCEERGAIRSSGPRVDC